MTHHIQKAALVCQREVRKRFPSCRLVKPDHRNCICDHLCITKRRLRIAETWKSTVLVPKCIYMILHDFTCRYLKGPALWQGFVLGMVSSVKGQDRRGSDKRQKRHMNGYEWRMQRTNLKAQSCDNRDDTDRTNRKIDFGKTAVAEVVPEFYCFAA